MERLKSLVELEFLRELTLNYQERKIIKWRPYFSSEIKNNNADYETTLHLIENNISLVGVTWSIFRIVFDRNKVVFDYY
jgi:hypothetical protein